MSDGIDDERAEWNRHREKKRLLRQAVNACLSDCLQEQKQCQSFIDGAAHALSTDVFWHMDFQVRTTNAHAVRQVSIWHYHKEKYRIALEAMT